MNSFSNFNERNIVIFDGYCNFCSWGVDFILKRDNKKLFLFAASQSEGGKQLLERYNIREVKSVLYIKNGNVKKSSDAVLTILHDLGYPWKIFYVFIIIPEFIRDAIYNAFAKMRYSVFGKRKECRLPTEKERERFI